MAYKFTALKQNRKLICYVTFFLCAIALGFYWNYKMNYEMTVKFTQLDESDQNFPFGERKIDVRPWLDKGYMKINDYQIYNPNPIPLKQDLELAIAISIAVDDRKISEPELYHYFAQKNVLDDFLKKNIEIKYIGSTFNELSNLPTDDIFLVTFDNYQITISRKLEHGSFSLFAYDLKLKSISSEK